LEFNQNIAVPPRAGYAATMEAALLQPKLSVGDLDLNTEPEHVQFVIVDVR
jgi:hypothetical protein